MPKSYIRRIISNTLRDHLQFIFSKLLALSRTAEMKIYRPNNRIEAKRPKMCRNYYGTYHDKTTTYSVLDRHNKERNRQRLTE